MSRSRELHSAPQLWSWLGLPAVLQTGLPAPWPSLLLAAWRSAFSSLFSVPVSSFFFSPLRLHLFLLLRPCRCARRTVSRHGGGGPAGKGTAWPCSFFVSKLISFRRFYRHVTFPHIAQQQQQITRAPPPITAGSTSLALTRQSIPESMQAVVRTTPLACINTFRLH